MTLNNSNIRNTVGLYFGSDPAAKQSTINTYGEIANWDVSGVTDMRYAFFKLMWITKSLTYPHGMYPM